MNKIIFTFITLSFFVVSALVIGINQVVHPVILNDNFTFSNNPIINNSNSSIHGNKEKLDPNTNPIKPDLVIKNNYDVPNNFTRNNNISSTDDDLPCKMPPCPLGHVCIQLCPDSLVS